MVDEVDGWWYDVIWFMVDVIEWWWLMIWCDMIYGWCDRMMDDMMVDVEDDMICDGRWYEIEWWMIWFVMEDDMMVDEVDVIWWLMKLMWYDGRWNIVVEQYCVVLVTACYDHGNRLIEY